MSLERKSTRQPEPTLVSATAPVTSMLMTRGTTTTTTTTTQPSTCVTPSTWGTTERQSTTHRVAHAPEASSSSSHATPSLVGLSNPLLPQLWMGDVFVALSVTAAVAPALTVVDKAIVEQSARSGERGVILHSMKRTAASILSHPVSYFRSPTFGWMWLTYAATYTTANTMKTWNEQASISADRNADYSKPVKKKVPNNTFLVAGTTLVNSAASLVKDRAYARMFGLSPRSVPTASYLAWIMRDGVVIGSSFVLPAYVTPLVQDMTGWSHASSSTVSQLFTPVAAQLVAGPLHLWGLTLYNASAEHSMGQMLAAWRSGLVSVTGARMLRILPGYGAAGVVNQRGRAWWKQHLLEAQVRQNHKDGSHVSTLVTLIRSAASGRR